MLVGKAKELYVATLLVNRGLHVFTPLVDTGFDLVVGRPDGKRYLPVQVKFKNERTGYSLKKADAEKFRGCDAVLAFGAGLADEDAFHFFTARDWWSKAEDRGRRDDKVVVYAAGNEEWLEQFRGARGIAKAFQGLFSELVPAADAPRGSA